MIFALDATALVHVMYHITEPKDPPDVVERMLNRLDHLKQWSEMIAEKVNQQPRQLAIFDGKGTSFRHRKLPSYKAQRTHDPEIYECLDHAKESLVNSSDWSLMVSPDEFEADDLIASIAAQHAEPVVIHSSDKDFNQCLVNGRVGIVKRSGVDSEPKQKETGGIVFQEGLSVKTYTERDLYQQYGFYADRWIDYQCLVGDAADNIKGAEWIGGVTAKVIIQRLAFERKSLEATDTNDIHLNTRQRQQWPQFIERLPLLRDLFTLRTDLTYSL